MDYSSLSDVELLARIVGPRVAGRIYQGALAPPLSPDKGPNGRETLLVARELVLRDARIGRRGPRCFRARTWPASSHASSAAPYGSCRRRSGCS
jgi:hypothetical protein